MAQNGSVIGSSGYEDITEHYNNAIAQGYQRDELRASDKRKETQFKASHTLLICFLLCLSCLHGLGIYFFTKGFLLTRLVLDEKSECAEPPFKIGTQTLGSPIDGCWHPKTFDKAVVIIIDALRYDFTVPFLGKPQHFHNALSILHETAVQSPEKAFLLPFIADPPTTTLQRLKGLTTGTLPTFIDAGSNFAGTAIEEDNLVAQLRDAGKNLVHLGDDTWHSLFPGYFDANLTHAYDSFNVWDLHTVDNGVTEHLLPLLQAENRHKWDVVFGHFLGVDHAGHRYGPDHPATAAKLREMDSTLRNVIALLDEETLLVVMGDHGMDVKGDHGGESDDEVEAALWMYSNKGVFGRGHNGMTKPPATAKERAVGQIDLVPTLSLLLGMPIPFNNLGAPISEAFVGSSKPDWQNLASVNALAAVQINRYQHAYSRARGLDESTFSLPEHHWLEGLSAWQTATDSSRNTGTYWDAHQSFCLYQQETLRICRDLWARFDIPNMLEGIAILTFSVLYLAIYARSTEIDKILFVSLSLTPMSICSGIGTISALILSLPVLKTVSTDAALLGFAAGGILGFGSALMKIRRHITLPYPKTVWGWLALAFTLSQSIGFASNSYTIWEDEILLCFLGTFALVAFVSSIRQEFAIERVLGTIQSSIFLFSTRVVSLSRLCREEQMPYCKSTYYASTTSSTSAPWQLLIPLLVATFLPEVIKAYYQGTLSYAGWGKVWISSVLRLALLGTAIFWILDAADDNDWLTMEKSTLKTLKIVISRLILLIPLVVGATTFMRGGNCIEIAVSSDSAGGTDSENQPKPNSVKVFGYANVHGTRYFLLLTNWLMALILLQKPMGTGALAVLTIQILALLEIIDANNLSQSAIGPIVLGLLGSFQFFKTGHQATLASIQWESAFIPFTAISYPGSPLMVVLNSFGAQILTTVAVPLIVLWKKPPRQKGLLGDVVKALATLILYYAVLNLATTMWAGHLRRHLMLYRIFSPRFMTGAAVLLIVDLVGTFAAIGALRWNFNSIAEVFGWT